MAEKPANAMQFDKREPPPEGWFYVSDDQDCDWLVQWDESIIAEWQSAITRRA